MPELVEINLVLDDGDSLTGENEICHNVTAIFSRYKIKLWR